MTNKSDFVEFPVAYDYYSQRYKRKDALFSFLYSMGNIMYMVSINSCAVSVWRVCDSSLANGWLGIIILKFLKVAVWLVAIMWLLGTLQLLDTIILLHV